MALPPAGAGAGGGGGGGGDGVPPFVDDDLAAVDWVRATADLAADDFDNGRSPEALRRAFHRAPHVALAWDGTELVGMARLLSDGVANAYLLDVWTRSSHRRRGIGTALVERLCAAVPGQHVGLQTVDAVSFYRRLGFTDQPRFLSKVVGRWLADSPGAAPHRPEAEPVPTAGPGGEMPVVDPVATSVAAYTDRAADYESEHAAKMADRVERFARSLPAPSLILDAGCGPGRDLARFASRGHVARGVDLNPAFVDRASTKAPTWQVDLRHLDAWSPPALFDGIWASASLVHLPDRDASRVLGHFAGILRPGGRLYACVATDRDGWQVEPGGRRWYRRWHPDEFVRAVEGAGFTVDDVDRGPFVEVWATRAP